MFLKIPIIRERLVILPLLFHSQEKKNKTHKKKKKPKRTNTIKEIKIIKQSTTTCI